MLITSAARKNPKDQAEAQQHQDAKGAICCEAEKGTEAEENVESQERE
jgi:hypothetical protein